MDDIFFPEFDESGNQTRIMTDTGIWTLTYDSENRPTEFTTNTSGGTTTIQCTYDSVGRRSSKKVIVNGTVISYHRFIYRGYLQITCCDLTRSSHPTLWLITWDITQPVATRPLAIQINGTWFTYGWDLSKNICELYGSNGYIAESYTYSPYGVVGSSGNISQPIQWSSEHYDCETGLISYIYRYYTSKDGRFISNDLILDKNNYNSYTYAGNEPIMNIDILGKARKNNREKITLPNDAELNKTGINCIGYASGLDGDLQPNTVSLDHLFTKLGWQCKKIQYDEPCIADPKKPDQQIMVVFIHAVYAKIEGEDKTLKEVYDWVKKHYGGKNFWTIRNFWNQKNRKKINLINQSLSQLVDYHGVKKENCTEEGKQWSYVAHRSDTKLPIMYTHDPNTTSDRESTFAKYCCRKNK